MKKVVVRIIQVVLILLFIFCGLFYVFQEKLIFAPVIGEVKHNSKLFSENSNKALKGLVEMAKETFPDKIILACYEDSNDKLEKAKKGLIHLFKKWEYQPEIGTLQLHTPDYFHLNGHRYFYH